MRIFLFILLSVVLGTAAPVWGQESGTNTAVDEAPFDASTAATEGDVIAFVGEKIFVEERNLKETIDFTLPDGSIVTRTLPNFDSRYEARYKILNIVAGDYTLPEIDFVAFNHYGRPYFPKVNPVLLFAINYEGKWIHSKYLSYTVHETTDGDWAICGLAVNSSASEPEQTLAAKYEEPIGFLKRVKTHDGAPCVSGTRASNLYAFQDRVRFAPNRYRVACNRELGEADNTYFNTMSAPDANLEAKLHTACVIRRTAEDTRSHNINPP